MSFSINHLYQKKVTYADILARVGNDERVILCMYLEIPKIPCLINSPLRTDNKPSFRFLTQNEKIYWVDFSTGEKGNLIEFLCRYLNLSYENLIDRLDNDTVDTLPRGTKARCKRLRNNSKNEVSRYTLRATHREWTDYDKEYWEQYGISIKALKKANVYPVKYVWFVGDTRENSFYFVAEKYAYAYYEFKDGETRCKIYQPYSKDRKWMSNLTNDIWSLWTLLPEKGEELFITSSLKDGLNLWLNTRIPAVSMQGEGYKPKKKVIDELKKRFKTIWVFFDNDYNNPNNPGVNDAKALCDEYGLYYIAIPAKYEAKDPSDLYKKYGKDIYLKAINESKQIALYYKENFL